MAPAPEQWLAEIRASVSADADRVTVQTMSRIERALREHPESSSLWCLRGDFIQLLDDEAQTYELKDALASYEHAAAINSSDPEPLESLGYYFDAIDEQLPKAERFFRKALSLGAGPATYAGLARVLAQLGRRSEALELLSSCPDQSATIVTEIQREIAEGLWEHTSAAG